MPLGDDSSVEYLLCYREYPRSESNRHFAGFKSAASTIGLRGQKRHVFVDSVGNAPTCILIANQTTTLCSPEAHDVVKTDYVLPVLGVSPRTPSY